MLKLEGHGGLLAGLMLAVCAGRAQAEVTRGPYLQSVSEQGAVVRWQTDLASGLDSRVLYGGAPDALGSSAPGLAVLSAHDAGRLEHTVMLTGLTASTRYYYEVGTATDGAQAGGSAEYYVETAPAVGALATASVLVFGDSGNGTANQLAVRDRMEAVLPAPDLVLTLGDIAYDTATSAELTSRFFGVYPDILRHAPLYPAVGNHEASQGASDSTTQTGPYFEAFHLPSAGQAGGLASSTEAYYAFDHGLTHFIMLDSDDSSTAPGSAQLTWLVADLAAVPRSQQWIVVAFHHPPYSKGSHDSDSSADSGGRMVRMRENVLPLLEAGGVDLVLAGHSHSYERSYLIDRAYGYGAAPSFPTPAFSKLDADGRILDAGDGDPFGDGAYEKDGGASPHGGALYVVAGHAGSTTSGAIDHPVMAYSSLSYGFCRLDIDETTLTLTNVRADGAVVDRARLQKPPICSDAGECDDADPCTDDVCVEQRCHNEPIVCDDSDACTVDACDSNGSCAATPLDCGDGDACTTDSCDPGSGCEHPDASCDGGSACTVDACDSVTGCEYTPVSCDDGTVCTTDSCDTVLGCQYDTITCSDADACTADACDAVLGCQYAAIDCGDADACTSDSCDVLTGCAHAPLDCDDGSACSTDSCHTTLGCQYAPVSCDDGNACTAESCDSLTGCAHAPVPCDDDSACTSDSCAPASGCQYAPVSCDDGDACTADSCDALAGCAHAALDCQPEDASTPMNDGGDSDADAGTPRMDAGMLDAEAGTSSGDASVSDRDATIAEPDVGTTERDAASGTNAPQRDGGDADPSVDADAPLTITNGGCGCRVSRSRPPQAWTLLLLLAVLALRRLWRPHAALRPMFYGECTLCKDTATWITMRQRMDN